MSYSKRAFVRPIVNGKQLVTPEYRSWQMMKNRCTNPRAPDYERYGARGVSVCKRWLNSFPNFLADMGARPPGSSLERSKNNENYSPKNCTWATPKIQARNRRGTILTEEKAVFIRAALSKPESGDNP
jgi:hypothetical protein